MKERITLEPGTVYTLMSVDAAARQLASQGYTRAETSKLGLNEIHDELARHLPGDIGDVMIIVTKRSFQKITDNMDRKLIELYGKMIDPSAVICSRDNAIRTLESKGVEIPEDADEQGIEDAISAMLEIRHIVLKNDAFAEYGEAFFQEISKVPSGRALKHPENCSCEAHHDHP